MELRGRAATVASAVSPPSLPYNPVLWVQPELDGPARPIKAFSTSISVQPLKNGLPHRPMGRAGQGFSNFCRGPGRAGNWMGRAAKPMGRAGPPVSGFRPALGSAQRAQCRAQNHFSDYLCI